MSIGVQFLFSFSLFLSCSLSFSLSLTFSLSPYLIFHSPQSLSLSLHLVLVSFYHSLCLSAVCAWWPIHVNLRSKETNVTSTAVAKLQKSHVTNTTHFKSFNLKFLARFDKWNLPVLKLFRAHVNTSELKLELFLVFYPLCLIYLNILVL